MGNFSAWAKVSYICMETILTRLAQTLLNQVMERQLRSMLIRSLRQVLEVVDLAGNVEEWGEWKL